MVHNKIWADETENYFKNNLISLGVPEEIIEKSHRGFYDFKINNVFIEVKSANLWNKNGSNKGKKRNQMGNFEFTRASQLKDLKDVDAWVVFILRWRNEFLRIGAIPAKQLNPKQRYYSPQKVLTLNPISIEELAGVLNA